MAKKKKLLEVTSDIIGFDNDEEESKPKKKKEKKKEEPEEKKKELSEEEQDAELLNSVPSGYRDAMKDQIEDSKQDWKTCIDRLTPPETEDGIRLKLGQIAKYPGLFSPEDLEELIDENFGAGHYAVRLMNKGRIKRRYTIKISGSPKPTAEERKRAATPKAEDYEDRAKTLEKKKEELLRELELRKTEKRVEKEIKKLEEEEKEEEEEDDKDEYDGISPFMNPLLMRDPRYMSMMGKMGMPMPGYMPSQEKQEDPKQIEARLKKEMALESENNNLKNQMAAMQAKLDALIEANMNKKDDEPKMSDMAVILKEAVAAVKPQPTKPAITGQDLLTLAGVVLPILQGMFKDAVNTLKPKEKPEKDSVAEFVKMADALGLNKERKDETAAMLQKGMELLTTQLQTGMTASSQMQLQGMQTVMEMMRQSMTEAITNAGGTPPGEPEDWKVSVAKKLLDAGQMFTKELFGFNKERLELDKKKLDALLNKPTGALSAGYTQPVVRPSAPVHAPATMPYNTQGGLDAVAPVVPPKKPASPLFQTSPPQPASSNVDVNKLQQHGQNLFQAAVGAVMSGVSPQVFAQETLDLAGEEITEWIIKTENPIEDIRKLADAFHIKEQFDQFINLNVPNQPSVDFWLKEWVGAVKEIYQLDEEEYEEEKEEITAPPQVNVVNTPKQQPPKAKAQPAPALKKPAAPKKEENKKQQKKPETKGKQEKKEKKEQEEKEAS